MRKYIVFTVFALSLSFSADAMRFLTKKNVLCGMQAAVFFHVSFTYFENSYNTYNARKNNDRNLDKLLDMPKVVRLWVRKKLEGHIPNPDSIALKVSGIHKGWSVLDGKVGIIKCGSCKIDELAKALTFCSKNMNSSITSYEQKVIDSNSFNIKYLISLLRNKYMKKSLVASALTPLAVQTFCSTLSYGAKKIFGMNSFPKTFPDLIVRSLLTLGSIFPKTGMCRVGFDLYDCRQAWKADRYACKYSTKQELIAARDDYKMIAYNFTNYLCNKKSNKEFLVYFQQNNYVIYWLDFNLPAASRDFVQQIASLVRSLKIELFKDGDDIVQIKKNHPFKFRWYRFWLKFAYFVLDNKNPWPGDRADAIDRVLKEFDQKNMQIS